VQDGGDLWVAQQRGDVHGAAGEDPRDDGALGGSSHGGDERQLAVRELQPSSKKRPA